MEKGSMCRQVRSMRVSGLHCIPRCQIICWNMTFFSLKFHATSEFYFTWQSVSSDTLTSLLSIGSRLHQPTNIVASTRTCLLASTHSNLRWISKICLMVSVASFLLSFDPWSFCFDHSSAPTCSSWMSTPTHCVRFFSAPQSRLNSIRTWKFLTGIHWVPRRKNNILLFRFILAESLSKSDDYLHSPPSHCEMGPNSSSPKSCQRSIVWVSQRSVIILVCPNHPLLINRRIWIVRADGIIESAWICDGLIILFFRWRAIHEPRRRRC